MKGTVAPSFNKPAVFATWLARTLSSLAIFSKYCCNIVFGIRRWAIGDEQWAVFNLAFAFRSSLLAFQS